MMLMNILYFFTSLVSSTVGAISGIGGGVIIKPVLDSMGSFNVSTINFLSGSTVLVMTFVTIVRSGKSKVSIDKRISTFMALGGILGGIAGKSLFELLKKKADTMNQITVMQSVILGILCIGVIIFTHVKNQITPMSMKSSFFSFFIGVILGIFASFLGIGGGPINLALLYFFFSMDSKTAALNSIYIIFFSQLATLILMILGGNIPDFQPVILMVMIAGGIGGSLIGASLSHRMSHEQVDKLFIAVLIFITFLCVFNSLKYLL